MKYIIILLGMFLLGCEQLDLNEAFYITGYVVETKQTQDNCYFKVNFKTDDRRYSQSKWFIGDCNVKVYDSIKIIKQEIN